MTKREIERLLKKYPEISSVSLNVKEYPRYAEGDRESSRCAWFGEAVVFFHKK